LELKFPSYEADRYMAKLAVEENGYIQFLFKNNINIILICILKEFIILQIIM